MSDTALRPYAVWTDDCQGKKDFDGPIISVSTRYWPGPEGGGMFVIHTGSAPKIGMLPYGERPSAHSSIILRCGPREPNDGGGDYLVWRDQHFEGDTEAEVKAAVEKWVAARMEEIVGLLGGIAAFQSP